MSLHVPVRPSPSSTPSTAGLARLVQRIAMKPDLWRPAVRFGAADGSGDRYWARLDSPDGIDVWLLTWLPSQGTDLHDHGDAAAAFTVVQGALTEARVDQGVVRATVLGIGETGRVEPGVVHDVRNDLDEPAVSIHAYSPELTRMTFYDLIEGQLTARREIDSAEPEVAS